MSPTLPSPLPLLDRALLHAVQRVVPANEREDWSRTWQAELWHARHQRSKRQSFLTGLSIGLTRDALWLRTDSWRRAFDGTPTLCLASLLSLCLLSALIALFYNGSWHALTLHLSSEFERFLLEVPFVVFVSFATSSRRHRQQPSAGRWIYWLKGQLFFATKTSLILFLTFLLSADLCLSVHASLPNFADVLQIWLFLILALLGLRWSFLDQEQRCKQCLRSLTTPARVGRPSHNLLEWNGTELLCKQGHGLLSIPEMETSWCQTPTWDLYTP